MTEQQRQSLARLASWHAGQATTYRKAAPITAMDHPELTTSQFEATANWHDQQAQLLREACGDAEELALSTTTNLPHHVNRF